MPRSSALSFTAGLLTGLVLTTTFPAPCKVSDLSQSPPVNHTDPCPPQLNSANDANLIKCSMLGVAGHQYPLPVSKPEWWGCDFPETPNQPVLVLIPATEGELEVLPSKESPKTEPEL